MAEERSPADPILNPLTEGEGTPGDASQTKAADGSPATQPSEPSGSVTPEEEKRDKRLKDQEKEITRLQMELADNKRRTANLPPELQAIVNAQNQQSLPGQETPGQRALREKLEQSPDYLDNPLNQLQVQKQIANQAIAATVPALLKLKDDLTEAQDILGDKLDVTAIERLGLAERIEQEYRMNGIKGNSWIAAYELLNPMDRFTALKQAKEEGAAKAVESASHKAAAKMEKPGPARTSSKPDADAKVSPRDWLFNKLATMKRTDGTPAYPSFYKGA